MAARKKVSHKWTVKKPSMPSDTAGKTQWDSYKKKMRDYNWTQRQIASAKAAGKTSTGSKRRAPAKKKRRSRR